jgi:predicted DNA-binding transcriptional regulator AlpA
MELLGKIRRMHVREKLSERAIAKRTGLSRNTVHKWLKKDGEVEVPKYVRAKGFSKLGAFTEELEQCLKADALRPKKDSLNSICSCCVIVTNTWEKGAGRLSLAALVAVVSGGAEVARTGATVDEKSECVKRFLHWGIGSPNTYNSGGPGSWVHRILTNSGVRPLLFLTLSTAVLMLS